MNKLNQLRKLRDMIKPSMEEIKELSENDFATSEPIRMVQLVTEVNAMIFTFLAFTDYTESQLNVFIVGAYDFTIDELRNIESTFQD